jgi:hypothetical protein
MVVSIERFARPVLEHDEPHLRFVSMPVAVDLTKQSRSDEPKPRLHAVLAYVHVISLIKHQTPAPDIFVQTLRPGFSN